MKNLILICLVSFFTTQLLATQVLKATKFETSITTETLVKDKPIIFESLTIHNLKVEQVAFEHLETNLIETAKYPTESNKPKNGYNYRKHQRKSNRVKFFNRLLNRTNCNSFSNKS